MVGRKFYSWSLVAGNRKGLDAGDRLRQMRRLDKLPLRPKVEYDGQPYFDEPIYRYIKHALTDMQTAVRQVFGHHIPEPIRILERYEHTKLRWMKPDGNGGLTPR